ncbi:legumain-like isoform X2 [Hemibagrus wyckioides]|uniref:legumain-like isoform X2 n=1 Tax=Hemibagrus wyckioides TaxID=337641 RepID=UPI00266BF6AB|nr:legumain-like isoform X2 [Hemibagrus wyckioides]
MENTNGKQWVLLAAGSKDWENYRHQADVCHAYQVVRENGIPDDQIVVMMYDDIAYNEENPFRGNIINVPGGEDVYAGVPKDYTREDVSAANFLAVLRGDSRAIRKRGPKKVIESGPNDSIFIYLSDHGSHGIFHFPNSTLYAPDLIDTVKEMSRKDKFSQIDLRETTLQDQFNYIKENVTKWEKNQTPCNYGNRSMLQTPLSEFLGWSPDYEFKDYEFKSRNFDLTSVVESTNVPLLIQQNRIRKEQNHRRKQSLKRQYNELQRKRNKMNEAMQEISKCCARDGALRETLEVTRLYELKVVAEHFRTTVFNWDEEAFVFTLSHQQVLVNLCECGLEVESITAAIDRVRQRIQF